MPDVNFEEINTKLDTALSGIKKAQEIASRNAEKIDSIDIEQYKKLVEESATNLEDVNKLKLAKEKQDELLQKIEKTVYTASSGGTDNKEKLAKEKNEFIGYLRKGKAMNPDIVENICDKMAKKSFFDNDDRKFDMFKKDLQEGVNPDGGYWIRPEISDMVITRQFETSPMRSISNVETITSNELQIIIDDNQATSGGWVGETESRSTTATPKIGQESIFAHEQYAQPRATQWMLDDVGFDVEGWLQRKITDIFTRTENTAFVSGDGNKKPKGILSYSNWTTPGTYERGKVEQINSGVAGAITADSLKDLQNAVPEFYQPGSIFGMKRATFGAVIKLKDGQGNYLLNTDSLKQGDNKILLGAPIIFMNDLQAIASAALAVVYGNFKMGYTIVDRVGIRVIRDIYSSKPYVVFYTTKRVGGAVTNFESFKILKLSA